ncbi:MAG: hypothetical protein K2F83_06390, partial [Oscillospiraceae bacterium]|nr:hypothetical protein [Oscillospiraceae bacterium]
MDFYDLGRKAGGNMCARGIYPGRKVAREGAQALEQIKETQRRLEKRAWNPMPTAVEWILDNAYLALREGNLAGEEFKHSRYLRRTKQTAYLRAVTDCLVGAVPNPKEDELLEFLKGLQETGPLSEEELSLFLPGLRVALCCRLAQLCQQVEVRPDDENAANQLSAIFDGLRTISTSNLGPTLERSSVVEQILRRDPAGAYEKMSEETRAYYRYQVCRLARKHHISEKEAAECALSLSGGAQGKKAHIGWFLFQEPLGKQKKQASGVLYVAAILLPTFFIALWLGFALQSPALFFSLAIKCPSPAILWGHKRI